MEVVFDYKHAILALKNDTIILKYLTENQDSLTRKQLIIQFAIIKFFLEKNIAVQIKLLLLLLKGQCSCCCYSVRVTVAAVQCNQP